MIKFLTPDGREVAIASSMETKGFSENTEIPDWSNPGLITSTTAADFIVEVEGFKSYNTQLVAVENKLHSQELSIAELNRVICTLVNMMGGAVIITKDEVDYGAKLELTVDVNSDGAILRTKEVT